MDKKKSFMLTEVKKFGFGIIAEIKNGAYKQKLNDMGFIRGEKIKFMERSPFGDPITVDVRGCLFGLNKKLGRKDLNPRCRSQSPMP